MACRTCKDLHALKSNKQTLVVERFALVPVTKLVDAVGASDEDEDSSETQEAKENLELPVRLKFSRTRTFAVSCAIVDGQNYEDEKSEHLEGESSKPDIDTSCRCAARLSRHCTTCCLQDQRNDVARYEYLIIKGWFEASNSRG